MSELDRLEAYLKERGIPHERIDETKVIGDQDYSRHQIIVSDKDGHRSWDAICHRGSYGWGRGLLEVMGDPVIRKADGDRVKGWLTAQDVIDRLEGRA